MKAIFEAIYANNVWSYGSGSGSLAIHNRGYIRMLEEFMRRSNVRKVLDFGCGDWQFSQFIDWNDIYYIGIDVASSVIETNRNLYSKPGVEFRLHSGDLRDLPTADLLIVKDVLQHWSNQSILSFLPIFSNYRFCLITNCVSPRGRTINEDCHDGSWRYLDISLGPFNVQGREIYSYVDYRLFLFRAFLRPKWRKKVILVENPAILMC